MRKLAILTFQTLDGVMQAPSVPEEDRSGGFTQGGWANACWDEVMTQVGREAMSEPYDLLIGRTTYDIFSSSFIGAGSENPASDMMSNARKYVVTNRSEPLEWTNSEKVSGNLATAIEISPEPLMSTTNENHIFIADDGVFPNNANQPLVIARQFLPGNDPVAFEGLFEQNGWPPSWRAGIFNFDHYHSTAHEVLGCFQGSATLHFGGSEGISVELTAGDAVIIPAGVAHRCVKSNQFSCVGAYPAGQSWDTCYGKPGERPAADERIELLGGWQRDPLAPN
jgi:uncharacterized protein YjlB